MRTWLPRSARAAALGAIALAGAALAGPAAGTALGTVAGDFNGDGVPDRAELIATGEVVDLEIYLSAGGRLPDKPTVVKHAIGWQGVLPGTEPSMSVTPRGTLVLVFKDDAVERARWRQELKIAFDGGRFVVAGYGYTLRDPREPERSGSCELDLVTGHGRRNHKPVSFPAGVVPLAEWTDRSFPKLCAF